MGEVSSRACITGMYMKPDSFWHLTLNTGRCRKSFRSDVSESNLSAMSQMNLLNSQAEFFIGDERYRVEANVDVFGSDFTLYKEQTPLIYCVLSLLRDDESVWEMVERFYLRSTDQLPVDWALPEKPPSSPWLAVTLVGIARAPQVTTWLCDFDRCMVWLIIDSFFSDDKMSLS